MLINNTLAVLGGALMGLANAAASYEMLILGRFLIGAYSGTHRHMVLPSALLSFTIPGFAGQWGRGSCLSPVFFPLPRADIRACAHVRGGDRPHSLAGCLGDAQPTGHRHWHSDRPGDWAWPHGRIDRGLGWGSGEQAE